MTSGFSSKSVTSEANPYNNIISIYSQYTCTHGKIVEVKTKFYTNIFHTKY